MIARLWHGVTSHENKNEYEHLLRGEILPGIHRVEGYRGAYLLRREVPEGAEFVTLTIFDSMDAVRRFAGDDVESAVVPEGSPQAARASIGVRSTIRSWQSPETRGTRQAPQLRARRPSFSSCFETAAASSEMKSSMRAGSTVRLTPAQTRRSCSSE